MGNTVVLSARMRALTDMVTFGNRVCDVGCDHGFVSIYLARQGISPRVLAMDVRQGPLSRAQEHIRQQGLEDYIETRLSDGVSALKIGEADTLICAGMGGRLMRRILEEGREKLEVMEELILQPQSEIPLFRAYLRQAGYRTLAENMVYEDGKYYPMMKVAAEKGQSTGRTAETRQRVGQKADKRQPPHSGAETRSGGDKGGIAGSPDVSGTSTMTLQDYFGGLLLAERHPVLRQYLLKEQQSNRRILERLRENAADCSRTLGRVRELEEQQRLVRLALEQFGEVGMQGICGTQNSIAQE